MGNREPLEDLYYAIRFLFSSVISGSQAEGRWEEEGTGTRVASYNLG